MEIPVQGQFEYSDGHASQSVYVLINPVTHLV